MSALVESEPSHQEAWPKAPEQSFDRSWGEMAADEGSGAPTPRFPGSNVGCSVRGNSFFPRPSASLHRPITANRVDVSP
jgi:hypothetical protein